MSLVLGFARLLSDRNTGNVTNLTFNFNESSDITEQPNNDIFFEFLNIEVICNSNFIRYKCGFSKRGTETILIGGTTYEEYRVPITFYAYRKPDSNIVFFKTKTSNMISFIKHINKLSNNPVFEYIEIDFLGISKYVTNIAGSWFSTQSAQITSKSLHGHDIIDSFEFQELLKTGSITSLNVNYIYKETSFLLIISGKGSIYFKGKIQPKEEEFLLIIDAFSKFVSNIPN